jgi:hypothetical protein
MPTRSGPVTRKFTAARMRNMSRRDASAQRYLTPDRMERQRPSLAAPSPAPPRALPRRIISRQQAETPKVAASTAKARPIPADELV